MNRLLRDLYYHQAWADAGHWKALEALPAALEDATLRGRLHHYHLTQHAFLWLAEADGRPFTRTTVEDFKNNAALKEYAREFNTEAGRFLDEVPDSRLQENIVIPWGPKPPQPITVELALTQAAMHSHHHRAQNAVRLRELGGTPPAGDFIAWLWKGRPAPDWG
jgi:uncharacterized damage-inducible protein DinB